MNPQRFGFIFHVGLYNYYAFDDMKSIAKRKIVNGSEWYYGRLIAGPYMPPSGSKLTKEYHQDNFGNSSYFDVELNITREKIQIWMDICKICGATYVLITSRHHDGYCLWNTSTTDRKSNIDLLQIFKEEAENRDIEFGFYYSWLEFGKSMTVKYFLDVCLPQVKELIEYNPKYFWFDGDWEIKQKSNYITMDRILEELIEREILFNNRLGKRNREWKIEPSFYVFEDRFIPEEYMENWQHITTIGVSWGFNKLQNETHYKTGKQLFDLHNKVRELGGSLLLNLATDHNGDIDDTELESLYDYYELVNKC